MKSARVSFKKRLVRKKRHGGLRKSKAKVKRTPVSLIKKVIANSQPWKLETFKSFGEFRILFSNSSIFRGVDVGLGSSLSLKSAAAWDSGPAFLLNDVYVGADKYGDIYGFFNRQFGLTGNTMQGTKAVFSSKLFLTLRNQCNFGCFLKVYYIKTPISNSAPDAQTMDQILNSYIPGRESVHWSQNSDLTDLVGLSRAVKITSRKIIKFYPGETLNFALRTGWKYPQALDTRIFQSRNKFTRSIVFQMVGFPVHSPLDPTQVMSSQGKIDVLSLWKGRGKVVETQVFNSFTPSSNVVYATNPEGQQWQAGVKAAVAF